MSLIVVIEDETGTRMLIAAVLQKDGHDVIEAENGAVGLQAIARHKPDLVMSDIEMPQMSGLDVLTAMRADEALAEIPVILLTSQAERSQMRAGMISGADDYITKPFRPAELREAVMAQLGRISARQAIHNMATEKALDQQKVALDDLYAEQFGSQYGARMNDDDLAPDERHANATLLAVQIDSYPQMAHRLSGSELSEVVRSFYGFASDSINLFGAHHVEFDGAGMVAVFTEQQNTASVTHGLRAVKAGFGVLDAANRARQLIAQKFSGRSLVEFTVSIGLDSGPVSLARMKDALGTGKSHTVIVGETLVSVRALLPQFAQRKWLVGGTVQALRTMTGSIRVGKRDQIMMPGRSMPVDAGEITELIS